MSDRPLGPGGDFRQSRRGWAGRIAGSFGSLAGGKILGDVVTFGLFVLISRVFGQEGIGQYSFAIAFTGMFAIVSDLGISLFAVRELSHSSESFADLFGRIFSLRLALLAVAIVLLIAALPFLPISDQTVSIVLIVGGYQLTHYLMLHLRAVFLAVDRPVVAASMDGGLRIAAGSAAIVAGLLGASLTVVLSVLMATAVVMGLGGYFLLTRLVGSPRLNLRASKLLEVGREALPYGLSGAFGNIQQRLDVTLLGLMVGATAAGVYNVGYRPVFMLWFIPALFQLSILPAASRLHSASSPKLMELYRRSLNLGVLLGLPAAAGLYLVAPGIITLIFGDEFLESVGLLRLLAWLLPLAFMRFTTGAFLTSCGHQRERTRVQGWCLSVVLVLFLVLISLYGVYGAAVAALLGEALLVVLYSIQLRPILGWPRVGSRLLMAGTATGCFFVPFVVWHGVPMFGVVAASVVIYSGMLLLFPPIRQDELSLFLDILGLRSEAERSVIAEKG